MIPFFLHTDGSLKVLYEANVRYPDNHVDSCCTRDEKKQIFEFHERDLHMKGLLIEN